MDHAELAYRVYGVGIEIEGLAVHTGTGGLGGVRGPPAHAVKGELKGKKEKIEGYRVPVHAACRE